MTIANDFELVEMSQSQADKYLRHNEDNRRLAAGIAGRLVHDFSSDADYTLDSSVMIEEWRYRFMEFTDTGTKLTTGRSVIWPAKNGPVHRVKNSTAQTLTLKVTGQTGVTITAGSTGRYFYNGTDIQADY